MASKKILNIAIKAAQSSEHEYWVGAVLFKGGAVIRVATNSEKFIGYRRDLFEFSPTRHAEISVCHNMPKDVLKECSMMVVRISKSGKLVSAKPCKACIQAIKQSEISKLYYSNYQGEIVKINPRMVDLKHWTKEISPTRS